MIRTSDLNITRLTDQLWTGGDLPEPIDEATATIEAWRRHGIRRVIDNRIEWSDEALVELVDSDIHYLHAGVDDAGQAMPNWWFEEVIEFAMEGLRAGGGVLVHCHMGINRGPSAAYAVLLATGWDPIEAIDLIRTARPVAAVGYAEGALRWWHHTNHTPSAERRADRARLAQWRRDHPHETIRIIRQIRAAATT